MSLFVVLALFTCAAAVVRQEDASPKLTSFETGCYYHDDPAGEQDGAKGKSYRGLVSTTVSGRGCVNWQDAGEKATPDEEGEDGSMAWGNGLGNHNYCRNPDAGKKSNMNKPWCFTVIEKEDAADGGHKYVGAKIEACQIEECRPGEIDYKSQAQELGQKMKGHENCHCAEKVRADLRHTKKLQKEKFESEAFLQQKEQQTGLTEDGRPCFCK